MPIDPRQFALTPEGRQAERFADLERHASRQARTNVRARQYAETLGEVSTTLTTPTDLGGPSITTAVPASAFVAIYAEAEVQSLGTGAARVWLYDPVDLSNGVLVMSNSSTAFEWRATAPGGNTLVLPPGGQFIVAATEGVHTFSLRYSIQTSGSAVFRNRKLWAEVF